MRCGSWPVGRIPVLLILIVGLGMGTRWAAAGPFQLLLQITDPDDFTAQQRAIVQTGMDAAESLWESTIIGYQPGILLPGITITVTGQASGLPGLALARVTGSAHQRGFRLSTSGTIAINTNIIDEFADYGGTGLNLIDEIMAHEIGHVLGIGTQWVDNGVYTWQSGRYTGPFGLAAYRTEFDPEANFIPVELAGGAATANKHWDQIMRGSTEEGNPADPFSLSPLLGITDDQGRDFGQELMTGAIDPDYGAPFLSRTTVQSLRDLGFEVVPEPGTAVLLSWAILACATIVGRSRYATGNT